MNQIIPFGDEKLAWVFAAVGAALMNQIAWAAGAKDAPEYQPKDFIFWLKKKKPKREYISPNAAAAAFRMAVNR